MSAHYDIVMIGHVSRDIIEDPNGKQEVFAGPVVYSSASASRSGARVLVVTKVADADREELGIIHENGAELHAIDSPKTTSIHNHYRTADHETRDVTLLSAATPFALEELPDTDASIYHLAGLFVGEIPDALIEPLSRRGNVALDAQGVVRHNRDGAMRSEDWPAKRELLPFVHSFKTDAAEAELLSGEGDRERAAGILLEMGASEVMVTHNTEVLLANEHGIYRAPLTPRNQSGRTGRGDTCFAAYLARRLTHDTDSALRYAAALVSMKMESPGVFRATPQDVERRMAGG
ncbi:MAG: carbohydrate kinase [bacterium]